MKKNLFGGFPGGRFIGKEELAEVAKVIKARSPYRFYGLSLQNKTEALEDLCRKIFRRKYALAVSSGTAALHTALFASGVEKKSEVILPAYAWSSDLMAVLALGAHPVIAPIDETLGLDPAMLEACITDRTKVIIAVHMRGYPCDLKRIWRIAKKKGIKVIEDGAQCIGGRIARNPVGALGDISVFSFQYNKLVTCGEGGALLTDNEVFYRRAYRFHDLGMLRRPGKADPEGIGAMGSLGLNYRLSELQAAALIPQLKKMPAILKKLKKNHRLATAGISALCKRFNLSIRESAPGCEPNYAFLCLSAKMKRDAKEAYIALNRLKVPVQKSSCLDGHNFKVWKDFMKRENFIFKSVGDARSRSILEKSLYIEINSGA